MPSWLKPPASVTRAGWAGDPAFPLVCAWNCALAGVPDADAVRLRQIGAAGGDARAVELGVEPHRAQRVLDVGVEVQPLDRQDGTLRPGNGDVLAPHRCGRRLLSLGIVQLDVQPSAAAQGLARQSGEDAEVAHVAAQLAGRGHAVQRHPDSAGDAVLLRSQRNVGQVQLFAFQREGRFGVERLLVHDGLRRQGAARRARQMGRPKRQIGARHGAAGQQQVAARQIGPHFQRVERAGGGAVQHGRARYRGLQRFGQNGEARQAGAPLGVEGVVLEGTRCRQRHVLAVDLQVGQIDRAVGADGDQTDQIHLAADQGIGGRRAGPQVRHVAGQIGPHQHRLIAAGEVGVELCGPFERSAGHAGKAGEVRNVQDGIARDVLAELPHGGMAGQAADQRVQRQFGHIDRLRRIVAVGGKAEGDRIARHVADHLLNGGVAAVQAAEVGGRGSAQRLAAAFHGEVGADGGGSGNRHVRQLGEIRHVERQPGRRPPCPTRG